MIMAVQAPILAFLVFFALIAEVGPVRATVIAFVNPAVAVGLGLVILSEPLTVGTIIGFPLVLLGSYWATRAPKGTVEPVEATIRELEGLLADPGLDAVLIDEDETELAVRVLHTAYGLDAVDQAA